MGCSADATTGYGYVGGDEEDLDVLSTRFSEEDVTSGDSYSVVEEISARHGCEVGYAGDSMYGGGPQLYFIVSETKRESHYGASIIPGAGYDSGWMRQLDAFLAELGIDPAKLEGPGIVLAASYG